jgi:hypothetical protein
MAVEDKYVDTALAAGNFGDRKTKGGGETTYLSQVVAIAAGDDDGSVYRLFTVTDGAIPVLANSIAKISTAITGGTGYTIGVYERGVGGAAVDADLLMTTTSFTSTGNKDAVVAVTATNVGKPIWELLGGTESAGKQYDVCLVGATVGTAAGTVGVQIGFTS